MKKKTTYSEIELLFRNGMEILKDRKINSFFLSDLESLVESKNISCEEFDYNVFLIASEINSEINSLNSLFDKDNKIVWFDYLQIQIYLLFSGNKNKKVYFSSNVVLNAIAAEISEKFELDLLVMTAIINLIAYGILMIGVDTWCNYYANENLKNPKIKELYDTEVKRKKEIRENNDKED